MKFQVVKELRVEKEVQKGISVRDFLFVLLITLAAYLIRGTVSEKLQFVFILFTFLLSCKLTMRSASNAGKRYYQALWIFLIREPETYLASANPSKQQIMEEYHETASEED